jgi:hypothetical protein
MKAPKTLVCLRFERPLLSLVDQLAREDGRKSRGAYVRGLIHGQLQRRFPRETEKALKNCPRVLARAS